MALFAEANPTLSLSLLVEIKETEEKLNPRKIQDTADVRTTLHLQQNEIDTQEDAEGTGRGDG